MQACFDDAHAADPEDWPVAACHTESGRALNQGIVEGAAYWQRAQQVVAAVAE